MMRDLDSITMTTSPTWPNSVPAGMPASMDTVKEWVINKCKLVLTEDKSLPVNVVTPNNIPEFKIPRTNDHRLSVATDHDDQNSCSSGSVPCSPYRSPGHSPTSHSNPFLYIPDREVRGSRSAPPSPSFHHDDDLDDKDESFASMTLKNIKARTSSFAFNSLKQVPVIRRKKSLSNDEVDTIGNDIGSNLLMKNKNVRRNFSSCDTVRVNICGSENTDTLDQDLLIPTNNIERSHSCKRRTVSTMISPLAILTPAAQPDHLSQPSGCGSSSSSETSTPDIGRLGSPHASFKSRYSRRRSSLKDLNSQVQQHLRHLSVASDRGCENAARRASENRPHAAGATLRRTLSASNSDVVRKPSTDSGNLVTYSSCHSISLSTNPLAEYGELKFSVRYVEDKKQLEVAIIRAEHLNVSRRSDYGINSFAKAYLMPGKIQKQASQVVKHTRNPVFNELFLFNDISFEDLIHMQLVIKVYNKCKSFRRQEKIGEICLPLDEHDLSEGQECRMWKNLEKREEGEDLGCLEVGMKFQPKNKCLKICIKQGIDLPKQKFHGPPDCYVKLEIEQPGRHKEKIKRVTDMKRKESNPVFDAHYEFDISPKIEDLNYTKITLTVFYHERLRPDVILGQVKLGYGATEESELTHYSRSIQNPETVFSEVHRIMEMED